MPMDRELLWVLVLAPALMLSASLLVLLLLKTPRRLGRQRSERMRRLARQLGMRYYGTPGPRALQALPVCALLSRGHRREVTNLISDGAQPPGLIVFDYELTGQERDREGTFSGALYLVCAAHLPGRTDLPGARICRLDWFGGPVGVPGLYPLEFDDDPDFAAQYRLAGAEAGRMRQLLTPRVRASLRDYQMRGPRPIVELTCEWLLVYVESPPGERALVRHGAHLVGYALRLARALGSKCGEPAA